MLKLKVYGEPFRSIEQLKLFSFTTEKEALAFTEYLQRVLDASPTCLKFVEDFQERSPATVPHQIVSAILSGMVAIFVEVGLGGLTVEFEGNEEERKASVEEAMRILREKKGGQ